MELNKFFYKTIKIKPISTFNQDFPEDKMEEVLNRHGELGWELVSTTLQIYPYQLLLILKNNASNLHHLT